LEFADPALPPVPGETEMATISHEAVLSAAWILMRSAKNAGSPLYGGLGADGAKNPAAPEIKSAQASDPERDQAYASESVTRMISAYLNTPTHISSHFRSW